MGTFSELAPGLAEWVGALEMVWSSRKLCALACGEWMCRVLEAAQCVLSSTVECISEVKLLSALVSAARTCELVIELPFGDASTSVHV